MNSALNYIVSKIHTAGKAIIVFNPNSFESKCYVEHEVMFSPEEKIRHIELEETEYEVIEEDRDSEGWLIRAKIGLLTSIPALGYKIHRLIPALRHERLRTMHGKTYIENEKIRVEVDPLTGILTVTYRDLGTITCRLEIENEVGSVYSHRAVSYTHLTLPTN